MKPALTPTRTRPLGHSEALGALIAASTVKLFSYEEAILIYLKLRGRSDLLSTRPGTLPRLLAPGASSRQRKSAADTRDQFPPCPELDR